jgi:hypothetical protein
MRGPLVKALFGGLYRRYRRRTEAKCSEYGPGPQPDGTIRIFAFGTDYQCFEWWLSGRNVVAEALDVWREWRRKHTPACARTK